MTATTLTAMRLLRHSEGGGAGHRLERGDWIHIPRGLVRSFINAGSANGRLFILHCHGAAADFCIGTGKLPCPPDIADIAPGERYGTELVA
jgi:hypothetical protein